MSGRRGGREAKAVAAEASLFLRLPSSSTSLRPSSGYPELSSRRCISCLTFLPRPRAFLLPLPLPAPIRAPARRIQRRRRGISSHMNVGTMQARRRNSSAFSRDVCTVVGIYLPCSRSSVRRSDLPRPASLHTGHRCATNKFQRAT